MPLRRSARLMAKRRAMNPSASPTASPEPPLRHLELPPRQPKRPSRNPEMPSRNPELPSRHPELPATPPTTHLPPIRTIKEEGETVERKVVVIDDSSVEEYETAASEVAVSEDDPIEEVSFEEKFLIAVKPLLNFSALFLFVVLLVPAIVHRLGEKFSRGEYVYLSLHSDSIKAYLVELSLVPFIAFHDLRPLFVANDLFNLGVNNEILQYAKHQQLSSMVPDGMPWLWSPVPNRNLTTDPHYQGLRAARVPWHEFALDFQYVTESIADDLLWFANNGPPSFFFAKTWTGDDGQVTTSARARPTTTVDPKLDPELDPWCFESFAMADDSFEWDLGQNEGGKFCPTATNEPLDPDISTLRNRIFDNKLFRDRDLKPAWLLSRQVLHPLAFHRSHLGAGVRIRGPLGHFEKQSDDARLECLEQRMEEEEEDTATTFKSCERFVPPVGLFGEAQMKNRTAWYIIDLIEETSIFEELRVESSDWLEVLLPKYRLEAEEARGLTEQLLRLMEEALSRVSLVGDANGEKRIKIVDEAWLKVYRRHAECRLDRLAKSLLFLSEIALPRLQGQNRDDGPCSSHSERREKSTSAYFGGHTEARRPRLLDPFALGTSLEGIPPAYDGPGTVYETANGVSVRA